MDHSGGEGKEGERENRSRRRREPQALVPVPMFLCLDRDEHRDGAARDDQQMPQGVPGASGARGGRDLQHGYGQV